MITRGIRDYVNREWQSARDAKDAYWAARIARLGADEGLRIADELRRQMLAQTPGWPDDADRRRDLGWHVRFSQLLRDAGAPRRG